MRLFQRTKDVLGEEGWAGVIRRVRRKLAGWFDPSLVPPPSPPETPESQAELDRIASEMRALLKNQSGVSVSNDERVELCAQLAPWYQRIDLGNGIVTTGDTRHVVYDGDTANSLGYRLTSEEASQLRPLPKWRFIQPRLPQIAGNSILEIGSNCGFFSFEFAKMGAAQVTGVEVLPEYVTRAEALRDVMGLKQVKFLRRDWCLDQAVEKHDIVFTSDVLPHMMFPFLGLYRALATAKKFAIFDAGVHWAEQPSANFYFEQGYTRYHAFVLSDSLMMSYIVRCGVPLEAITKYPYARKRCLYVVDVSNAKLSPTILAEDDPLWSGNFTFDPALQAVHRKNE